MSAWTYSSDLWCPAAGRQGCAAPKLFVSPMWSTVCPLPNVFDGFCVPHTCTQFILERHVFCFVFLCSWWPDVPVTASWPRTSSVATLFRAISNGMNWGDGADALASIDGGMFWVMILYFYIAFCSVLVASRWLQAGFMCPKTIEFGVFWRLSAVFSRFSDTSIWTFNPFPFGLAR